ncbi:hypothetical protein C8J56DRAFT_836724 [Mycena floridula]|nr:hypothetical protein C8J56DRAFT_836724 [Mycena floridula]
MSLLSLSSEGSLSDMASSPNQLSPPVPRFPHTRAQLSAFTRQYKPLESYDSDFEGDEFGRVSTSFVNRIVAMLGEEQEDELKALLKETYSIDDEAVENSLLDLMHKHRDDIAGVPFLFLTPTRRPISRPSSRASTHSTRLYPVRPDTPQSAPSSPLALLFRRPHTPLTSPLAGGVAQPSSYMSAKSEYSSSPSSSPVLTFAPTTQFTTSLPASPLSSPRLLNAKASEFKPIQRPLSAASSNPGPRTETPSPDLWSHSPFRATSNLAIAAPLLPDQSHSNSSLRSSLQPDDSDEEDPFDPFPHTKEANPLSFNSIGDPDFDLQWSNSSASSRSPDDPRSLEYSYLNNYDLDSAGLPDDNEDLDADTAGMLTDGMTPFDVLSSVFGTTLAPSELEEALAANAYDFERAMAWLVDRALPPAQTPQIRTQNMGGRLALVSRDPVQAGRGAGYPNQTSPGRGAPRYVNGRPAAGGGNRVCRYFVAGECLRADCRFSHDLERALCRFWLRGTCAKGENCEFLHHLPKDVNISSLNITMGRMNISPAPPMHNPPPDDFPALSFDNVVGGKSRRPFQDTRFAAAVKKPAVQRPYPPDPNLAVRREVMGNSADNIHHRSAIIAPRPSPRMKLRLPTLVPTLPTGEAINAMYMSYRSRALQLGAARNACLSRAADAWRRGDGAAAKRFSREGQELNAKMASEMASAAGNLVRERAKLTEHAVKSRDSGWSDDPGDRTSRGKPCGGGLGVCLGIARKDTTEATLTADERTEVLLDLHGLHANEATEVLEQFLLALEQEHFYGLAYVIVGEEKHVGTQDVGRGASRVRLATAVREYLHRWAFPWRESDGIICVDPLTHSE